MIKDMEEEDDTRLSSGYHTMSSVPHSYQTTDVDSEENFSCFAQALMFPVDDSDPSDEADDSLEFFDKTLDIGSVVSEDSVDFEKPDFRLAFPISTDLTTTETNGDSPLCRTPGALCEVLNTAAVNDVEVALAKKKDIYPEAITEMCSVFAAVPEDTRDLDAQERPSSQPPVILVPVSTEVTADCEPDDVPSLEGLQCEVPEEVEYASSSDVVGSYPEMFVDSCDVDFLPDESDDGVDSGVPQTTSSWRSPSPPPVSPGPTPEDGRGDEVQLGGTSIILEVEQSPAAEWEVVSFTSDLTESSGNFFEQTCRISPTLPEDITDFSVFEGDRVPAPAFSAALSTSDSTLLISSDLMDDILSDADENAMATVAPDVAEIDFEISRESLSSSSFSLEDTAQLGVSGISLSSRHFLTSQDSWKTPSPISIQSSLAELGTESFPESFSVALDEAQNSFTEPEEEMFLQEFTYSSEIFETSELIIPSVPEDIEVFQIPQDTVSSSCSIKSHENRRTPSPDSTLPSSLPRTVDALHGISPAVVVKGQTDVSENGLISCDVEEPYFESFEKPYSISPPPSEVSRDEVPDSMPYSSYSQESRRTPSPTSPVYPTVALSEDTILHITPAILKEIEIAESEMGTFPSEMTDSCSDAFKDTYSTPPASMDDDEADDTYSRLSLIQSETLEEDKRTVLPVFNELTSDVDENSVVYERRTPVSSQDGYSEVFMENCSYSMYVSEASVDHVPETRSSSSLSDKSQDSWKMATPVSLVDTAATITDDTKLRITSAMENVALRDTKSSSSNSAKSDDSWTTPSPIFGDSNPLPNDRNTPGMTAGMDDVMVQVTRSSSSHSIRSEDSWKTPSPLFSVPTTIAIPYDTIFDFPPVMMDRVADGVGDMEEDTSTPDVTDIFSEVFKDTCSVSPVVSDFGRDEVSETEQVFSISAISQDRIRMAAALCPIPSTAGATDSSPIMTFPPSVNSLTASDTLSLISGRSRSKKKPPLSIASLRSPEAVNDKNLCQFAQALLDAFVLADANKKTYIPPPSIAEIIDPSIAEGRGQELQAKEKKKKKKQLKKEKTKV